MRYNKTKSKNKDYITNYLYTYNTMLSQQITKFKPFFVMENHPSQNETANQEISISTPDNSQPAENPSEMSFEARMKEYELLLNTFPEPVVQCFFICTQMGGKRNYLESMKRAFSCMLDQKGWTDYDRCIDLIYAKSDK
jgi:hypothetical protein